MTETEPDTRADRPRGDRGNLVKYALAAGVVLALAAFYFTGLYRYFSWDAVRSQLDGWQAQVERNLVASLVVFFAVYVAVTALSLPVAVPLTLVGGALFGRWLGTGVVSLASTLGATLAFLMSRYLLRDWVRAKFGDRLAPVNRGVEREGGFYLFTLRLVPAVPFFIVNLGMGLTPIRAGTFALVSWAGMLLGTFLYVNAGTAIGSVDKPSEVLSAKIIISLALLGLAPLSVRKLVEWGVTRKQVALAVLAVLVVGTVGVGARTYFRYQTSDVMDVAVTEYTNAEYPEDPAARSVDLGKYSGRELRLVKKDDTHFDFVFTSDHAHVAKVVFKDIDVSLMTPSLPEWAKGDDGLRRVALTDRQWNRQQVSFGGPGSPHVEVTGGDGTEAKELVSAELAKNCLNAGLWEVLLFKTENGQKAMYYQGWFTFPLGHYKTVFEHNTGLKYWKHWYYLEHWFDPAGTVVAMDKLREVTAERAVPARFDRSERVIAGGEQVRKRRTTVAQNVVTWGDFADGHAVRFASFVPPGRYDNGTPWKNEYRRMREFDKAILRDIRSPGSDKPLKELELVFSSPTRPGVCRFIVSGFDPDSLAQLPTDKYREGLYMPMGIGTPPFYQSYDALQANPPQQSPYASLLLDADDKWIDHHSFAIDGPVMHRDEADASKLHVYLLSYERHTLIAHIVVSME